MIELARLQDHQLLQRSRAGDSDFVISGRSAGSGDLYVRLSRNGRSLSDMEGTRGTATQGGQWRLPLRGIPAGGPYDLELTFVPGSTRNAARVSARDLLVGDLWVLAGQSNMQGYGAIEDAAPPDPQVRAYYMDGRWATAQDPIHNLFDAADPVHSKLIRERSLIRREGIGTGPGVSFGRAMLELTGVPQGLIACAHGGSYLSDWDPDPAAGENLYRAMLRRIASNGGRVAGVLWYQGCSEANDGLSRGYGERLRPLIEATRAALAAPELPWVIVQLARFHWNRLIEEPRVCSDLDESWSRVRREQLEATETIPHTELVPTVDLPMEDYIHLSGAAQGLLGRRLAYAAAQLLGAPIGLNPSLRPVSVRSLRNRLRDNRDLEIVFSGVEGSLRSPGAAAGFVLRHPDAGECGAVYRIDLAGPAAILRTSLPIGGSYGIDLYYGCGRAPACTVTDDSGRSPPAFGPVRLNFSAGTADGTILWTA
ncbi:MAG: sialate O-acetylesterase [Spirochaetales bacterium]|nr:sialate O-acetylesterase [Spirochaetales bacterium]